MAATAAAIPVLCDGTVFTTDMIPFSFKITGMTGRTERCVLGPGPGTVSANCSTVAAVAARISSVIARVVTLRVMAETGWRPAVGGMTGVALCGGIQMSSWFGGCPIARRMAAFAVIGAAGIMRPAAADEGRRGVTG